MFIFEPNLLLRRNEVFALLGSQFDEAALRAGAREWIDEHFDALRAKITPATSGVVLVYATGMCDANGVAKIERTLAERMKNVEGGPLAMKQTVERVRLCTAAKEHRKTQPVQFSGR